MNEFLLDKSRYPNKIKGRNQVEIRAFFKKN